MTSQRVDVQWVTDDRTQPGQGATRPDAAIVSKSQAIRNAVAEMLPVAPTNSAVLLLGEIGVGKELFAQAIHDASPRRHRPMVRVNAAAIPATLIERELFGHEECTFTGALSRQIGRLEEANGSTLFLDEIGELSPDVQAKLLRVLDEGTIERLGSGRSIEVDIRIIATTNRNLDDALRNGQLHEDLFHRLNEFPITITPLRGRRENIPDLACTRIDDVARPHGTNIESIAPESLNDLDQYSWPGNVRELRNLIERAMVVARSPTLAPWHPLAWSVSFSGSTQRYSVHAVDDAAASEAHLQAHSSRRPWPERRFDSTQGVHLATTPSGQVLVPSGLTLDERDQVDHVKQTS